MKKNSILLYAMALLIAFCFAPSVMAKKISYMGYQYNGKINKENIPEGQGTITMSVQDLIDKSKTIDFSISGIFNGPNVTNANFSTTWLSYKGDMEIKEGKSFVLKKGGVITTNGYPFPPRGEVSIPQNLIEHKYIDVNEDTQMSYSDLVRISMPYSYPFPKVPSKLNPPSGMTLYINPSINKVLEKQTGLWVPSKIVYYNIADGSNIFRYDPWSPKKTFEYKDSEGRIWKFEGEELLAVEYPDGSICKKELDFERVNAQYAPKLGRTKWNGEIVLDEKIDNKPIALDLRSGDFKNWDRYFSGVDKLLEIGSSDEYIEFKLQYDVDRSFRESDVDKIINFDNVIKDKLLSNISIPDNKELYLYCLSDDDITKKVKVFSVKNGVVSGRKQTAAAEKKAQQAKAAKEQAAYNQLCKKYGKKYADAAWNGRIIVGMPEELLKKMYYCVLRYESGSSKKYDSAEAGAIIWVTNGRISSISWK